MNPLDYGPREQAKALVAGLGALLTGLAAGDPIIAVVGGLISFYGVFAAPNGQ